MIISRTPYRISFLGGGTDYPAWYEQHGGCVLSTAINRYCYITCRYLPPFFENRHRIVYSIVEQTQTVDEIKHPAVRECLRFMNISDGMEIHHDGDLPKQTGLGTSSSFAVGLLNVLHTLRGQTPTPMQLAKEAIHVERDLCKENVGSQDQVCAAHGGLNVIRFSPDGNMAVEPLVIPTSRLQLFQRSLLLVFTGFSRYSSEIATEQIQNISKRANELSEMQKMADEGARILTGTGDLREFGELLSEGWKLKRSLSSRISNDQIDAIYANAMKAGASGGKLCGAGAGGFILLFVEPDKRPAVEKSLAGLLQVPFGFDRHGTKIIFNPDKTEE